MKAAIVLACLLAGCAAAPQGVEMSEADHAECAAAGCTVWSQRELLILIRKAWADGYSHGVKSL
jgi:starvation-inducible outer membrane lipoprotein